MYWEGYLRLAGDAEELVDHFQAGHLPCAMHPVGPQKGCLKACSMAHLHVQRGW